MISNTTGYSATNIDLNLTTTTVSSTLSTETGWIELVASFDSTTSVDSFDDWEYYEAEIEELIRIKPYYPWRQNNHKEKTRAKNVNTKEVFVPRNRIKDKGRWTGKNFKKYYKN